MADVVSTADLEHLWDPAAKPLFTVKPAEWIATYLPRYCQSAADRTDSDCRGLALMVRELQRDGFWERLFPDWESCCRALFNRPAEWVEQVVEGVRVLHAQGHTGPIGSSQAMAAQGHAEQMLSLERAQFAQAGDNRHTLAEPSLDIVKTTDQGDGGNSAAYLAARLKKAARDDLLAEIGPGKRFRSVRAAAIEAGIVKPVPTVRLVRDPPKVAAAIARHFNRSEVEALCEALLSLHSNDQ